MGEEIEGVHTVEWWGSIGGESVGKGKRRDFDQTEPFVGTFWNEVTYSQRQFSFFQMVKTECSFWMQRPPILRT